MSDIKFQEVKKDTEDNFQNLDRIHILTMKNLSESYVIVSCGTLQPELNFLKDTGFLTDTRILYTPPGLHERPEELKTQLQKQMENARRYGEKIIVVYGRRCYINSYDSLQDIDGLIGKRPGEVVRIDAENCIDMLTTGEERNEIANGRKIYWLSPGWLKNWKFIFKDWDKAKANETFPQNEKAILLDGINFFNHYGQRYPEKVLEFSDWLGLEIEPYNISLERFRNLIVEAKLKF